MTEPVFRDHKGKEMKVPPGNFGAGVICAQPGIALAYLTVLKNDQQGDVAGMGLSMPRQDCSLPSRHLLWKYPMIASRSAGSGIRLWADSI